MKAAPLARTRVMDMLRDLRKAGSFAPHGVAMRNRIIGVIEEAIESEYVMESRILALDLTMGIDGNSGRQAHGALVLAFLRSERARRVA